MIISGKDLSAKLKAEMAESADYVTVSAITDFAITARPVTISGITAEDRVYDGTTVVAINTSSAVINNNVDASNLTAVYQTFGAIEDKNVSAGKTVEITGYALTGDAAGNYELVSVNAIKSKKV